MMAKPGSGSGSKPGKMLDPDPHWNQCQCEPLPRKHGTKSHKQPAIYSSSRTKHLSLQYLMYLQKLVRKVRILTKPVLSTPAPKQGGNNIIHIQHSLGKVYYDQIITVSIVPTWQQEHTPLPACLRWRLPVSLPGSKNTLHCQHVWDGVS